MVSLLLAVPSCIYSFWHGVIPTSYFIFILVALIFLSRISLDSTARRDDITRRPAEIMPGIILGIFRHTRIMRE